MSSDEPVLVHAGGTAATFRYEFAMAPATCKECGSWVMSFPTHDRFHDWLLKSAIEAGLAYRSAALEALNERKTP